ncbi:MAG: hypothetical protein K0T99_03490 [Alphaproteobacteria bacterium]|nr:hypothetical protein [Alphaproteobacteria bacterium]
MWTRKESLRLLNEAYKFLHECAKPITPAMFQPYLEAAEDQIIKKVFALLASIGSIGYFTYTFVVKALQFVGIIEPPSTDNPSELKLTPENVQVLNALVNNQVEARKNEWQQKNAELEEEVSNLRAEIEHSQEQKPGEADTLHDEM